MTKYEAMAISLGLVATVYAFAFYALWDFLFGSWRR